MLVKQDSDGVLKISWHGQVITTHTIVWYVIIYSSPLSCMSARRHIPTDTHDEMKKSSSRQYWNAETRNTSFRHDSKIIWIWAVCPFFANLKYCPSLCCHGNTFSISGYMWYVIIPSLPSGNVGLVKLQSKLEHEWVIICHYFICI